jgi:hypothetical protein
MKEKNFSITTSCSNHAQLVQNVLGVTGDASIGTIRIYPQRSLRMDALRCASLSVAYAFFMRLAWDTRLGRAHVRKARYLSENQLQSRWVSPAYGGECYIKRSFKPIGTKGFMGFSVRTSISL